jgi:trehalose-phosphatase
MQTHLVTAQPFPRRDFLDIAEVAILLDVDGTILDVAATPQGVVVPASLVRTLCELHGRTGGALALVSGRLIENLDRLFVPLNLPCVGGHGVEWRIADGAPIQRRHAELRTPRTLTESRCPVLRRSDSGLWIPVGDEAA